MRLLVPDETVTRATGEITTFVTALTDWLPPENRTPGRRAAVDMAYEVARATVTGVQRGIVINPDAQPTGQDISELSLPIPATRRRERPVPTVGPAVAIIERHHLTVKISIYEPTPEGENLRRIPRDADFAHVFIAFTAADASAPERALYHLQGEARRARHTIALQEEQLAMKGWVICSYSNTNGESPESEPVSFIIS